MSARIVGRMVFVAACLLLAAALGIEFVRQLQSHWYALNYPFDIGVTEGREVVKAWMLRNGETIYPPMTDYPYLVTVYPPLYHLTVAATMLATGPIMAAGRFVSSLSTLLLVPVVAALIWRETKRAWLAAFVGLLVFTSPYVAIVGYLARPDMLSLVLSWAAIAALTQAFDTSSRRGEVWTGVASGLMVLALATKQQMLPAFLAGCSYGLTRGLATGRPALRTLGIYATTVVVATSVLLLAMQAATAGQFAHTVLQYPGDLVRIPTLWSMRFLNSHLSRFWHTHAALLVLACCQLGLAVARRRPVPIVHHYLAVSLPFLVLLAGTWGDDPQYFLGVSIALFVAAGLLVHELLALPHWGAVLAVLVLMAILPVKPWNLDLRSVALPNRYLEGPWATDKPAINSLIASVAGPVLIDDEGSYQLINGKPRLLDTMETGLYEKAGYWRPSESRVAADVESRQFDLIVVAQRFMSENLMHLVRAYYVPTEQIGAATVYRPRVGYVLAITDLALRPRQINDIVVMTEEERHNVGLPASYPFLSLLQEGTGWITYRLEAPRPIERLTVIGWPRVERSQPENAVIAEWTLDGESFRELWSLRADGGSGFSDIWGNALTGTAGLDTGTVLLRFRFTGPNAQLWADPRHRMVIQLELASTSDSPDP